MLNFAFNYIIFESFAFLLFRKFETKEEFHFVNINTFYIKLRRKNHIMFQCLRTRTDGYIY